MGSSPIRSPNGIRTGDPHFGKVLESVRQGHALSSYLRFVRLRVHIVLARPVERIALYRLAEFLDVVRCVLCQVLQKIRGSEVYLGDHGR